MYPKNAKEVLGLHGLGLAKALSLLVSCASFVLFIRFLLQVTSEQQFSVDDVDAYAMSMAGIVACSLIITLLLFLINTNKIYELYNRKAEFEILLINLVSQIPSKDYLDAAGKHQMLSELLVQMRLLATPEETRKHLSSLGTDAKKIIDDILVSELKTVGMKHNRKLRAAEEIPSSDMANCLWKECQEIEALRAAMNADRPKLEQRLGGMTIET